jgi:hypothetical protein
MTAAVWAAHDYDSDTVDLYSEYYRSHAEPSVHAQAIQGRGDWIPGVIDPASRGRSQHDGEQLIKLYKDLGLQHLEVADNSVEAGIYEVWQRMPSGRLKVFRQVDQLAQGIPHLPQGRQGPHRQEGRSWTRRRPLPHQFRFEARGVDARCVPKT